MNAFTIKDLENLSGIKAHTIRIWEQRYSFLRPQRTQTNIRYYSCDELKAVLNIALLNKYGYKISQIDRMNEEELREKLLTLTHVQAQQERLVNELIHCMVDLDMDKFEEILDTYIMNRGIDKMIAFLVFPFLEKIGILWMTNRVNPAQEHLVTNVIRQKLIVGIESAVSHVSVGKTMLLFLPEGEHHELGLLYVYYLLKSRGINVLYLGQNVPLKDVEFVANLKKPDILYCHLTSIGNNFSMERFVTFMGQKLPETPIIISGHMARNYTRKIPANVTFKKSLAEVLEYVNTLR